MRVAVVCVKLIIIARIQIKKQLEYNAARFLYSQRR